jgi:hypothetical protein
MAQCNATMQQGHITVLALATLDDATKNRNDLTNKNIFLHFKQP